MPHAEKNQENCTVHTNNPHISDISCSHWAVIKRCFQLEKGQSPNLDGSLTASTRRPAVIIRLVYVVWKGFSTSIHCLTILCQWITCFQLPKHVYLLHSFLKVLWRNLSLRHANLVLSWMATLEPEVALY